VKIPPLGPNNRLSMGMTSDRDGCRTIRRQDLRDRNRKENGPFGLSLASSRVATEISDAPELHKTTIFPKKN
jgi:hypothetical protein